MSVSHENIPHNALGLSACWRGILRAGPDIHIMKQARRVLP